MYSGIFEPFIVVGRLMGKENDLPVGSVCHAHGICSTSDRGNLDRLIGELGSHLFVCQDAYCRSIGHYADIQHAERIGDHRSFEDILDGYLQLFLGIGVVKSILIVFD